MNVLVVDDHPLIHEVLTAVARSAIGECRVFAAATLSDALTAAANAGDLRLALLDLELPDSSGLTTLLRFRAKHPEVPTVVVSASVVRATILSALEAGAAGYIPKTLSPKLMVSALRLVSSGGIYVPREAICADPLEPGSTRHDRPRLTSRQSEILSLLVSGYDNRTIATHLLISEGTVKQHIHALFVALGVTSRAQAIVTAMRSGFISK